jgi:hypothetical protein
MLKNPAEREIDTLSAKLMVISSIVSPTSIRDVSAGYCQRALFVESGMVIKSDGEA